jgi:hypothetical protein
LGKEEGYVDLNNAFSELADILNTENDNKLEVGSFDDFVQNIFAKSFPNYSYNTWHVKLISQFLDEVLATESKYAMLALPRYHLKSTICGAALAIYRFITSFGDSLYISYKEELATMHLGNVKQIILNNPVLAPHFEDMKKQSDTMIDFKIDGKKRVRMFSSGIFSMKRGLHTDGCVIVDDILGTVDNPMILTDLEKSEKMFNQEVMNIPNRGCPLIVFGTAMDYSDLLFKLKDNPQFMHKWLPAIQPVPDHEVLWEERYPKEVLESKKAAIGWKAFSSEFLLQPVLSGEAFFSRQELDKVIDKSLVNQSMYRVFDKQDRHVVAGVDIGKRKNPTHVAVFVDDNNENLINIHQAFWDNLDYIEQIERIKTMIANFGIDKMYIDATRGEVEDRGLPHEAVMIKFSGKGQRNQASYATDFAKIVEKGKIRLLDDDRFIAQITCVTNNLQAPVTAYGHGDAFWSVGLAVGAYKDYFSSDRPGRFSYMGNVQESFIDHPKSEIKNAEGLCKVCNKRGLQQLDNGKWRCDYCFATFDKL